MTANGKSCSDEYNRQIRRCTMKAAMIDMIRTPPMGFESVVHEHFRAYADKIIAQVQAWEVMDNNDSPLQSIKAKLLKANTVEALTAVLTEAAEMLASVDAEGGDDAPALSDALQQQIEKIKQRVSAVQAAEEAALVQQAQTFRQRVDALSTALTGIEIESKFDDMFEAPGVAAMATVTGDVEPAAVVDKAPVIPDEIADPEQVAFIQEITGGQYSEEAVSALLLHHPQRGNLDALVGVCFEGLDEAHWIAMATSKGEAVSDMSQLDLNQRIEEWVCFCGKPHVVTVKSCPTCFESRKPDSQVIFRKAQPEELAQILQDELGPLKKAFESSKHLLEIANGSGTVTCNISWEYQPAAMHGYGQQAKWSVFSAEMNDALEQAYLPLLAGDASEAAAGDVEITLAAHKYMCNLHSMTMSSSQNAEYTSLLRRRDLSTWVTELMSRAKVSSEQVQLLHQQLKARVEEAEPAAAAAEAAAKALEGDSSWPCCPQCTFVNAEDVSSRVHQCVHLLLLSALCAGNELRHLWIQSTTSEEAQSGCEAMHSVWCDGRPLPPQLQSYSNFVFQLWACKLK